MKTSIRIALIVCLGLIGHGFAQDELLVQANVEVESQHLWRGQLINDDWVIQPGASASYGKLSGGMVASIGLTDYHGRQYEVERADFYAAWTEPLEGIPGVTYSVGLMYYDYVRVDQESSEIFGRLSFDLPFSPSIACYYETDDADGAYLSLGARKSYGNVAEWGLGYPIGLDLTAQLGWGTSDYNAYHWGVHEAQFNDFDLSAAMPFQAYGFAVTPMVGFVGLLGADVKDSHRYSPDSSYVYLGVRVARAF